MSEAIDLTEITEAQSRELDEPIKEEVKTKKRKLDFLKVNQGCAGEKAIVKLQRQRLMRLMKAEELLERTFISGYEKRKKIYADLLTKL